MVKLETVFTLAVVGAVGYVGYKVYKAAKTGEALVKDTLGATGAGLSAATGGAVSKDTGEAYAKTLITPTPVTSFDLIYGGAKDIYSYIQKSLTTAKEAGESIERITTPTKAELPAAVYERLSPEAKPYYTPAKSLTQAPASYAPVPSAIQHVPGSAARVGNITRNGKVVVYA